MKQILIVGLGICTSLITIAAVPAKKPVAPVMGVYRWGAANQNGGAKCVEAFGEWIGEPDVCGEDFEANERWENNIAGGNWQLPEWGAWKKKNPSKRRLILSVPLLPGGWDRSGSRAPHEKGRVSLAQGANTIVTSRISPRCWLRRGLTIRFCA